MRIITIQPQTLPDLTRPYPFHIDADTGDVQRQDFWKGDPERLLGFQDSAEVQRVTLHRKEWSQNPQSAIGKYPVFITATGDLYNMNLPITETAERLEG